MRNLLIFLLFTSSLTFSQQSKNEVLTYQKALNDSYFDAKETPLKPEEIVHFNGLVFYEYNADFVVLAKLEKLENEKTFQMPTSSGKNQDYKRYGILKFNIYGQNFELEVYQNLNLIKRKGYEKHLFLPFIDLTSGNETYGAGRYLDIEIPDENILWLDFNKAYHPYCAYTSGYSCPITPDVNFLNIKVLAGVKF
ncbi:hypothetical protein SAMN02927937_01276 [Paenimyroides aquimaris]|uniref:DUF1684 domain-containing protein n=1 Tax=Paenimyroides marinum TaxID=1159016 RepID=A0A1H6KTB4_9FLAO|nr:DUF1684 domain-containing protein [Paenimyroides aquimaris]SEH76172.1 hypothetical protein SAMN02927937_01276 [Paenimyroides aquimaris]